MHSYRLPEHCAPSKIVHSASMNEMHLAIGSLMMLADYMTSCKQVFVDLHDA